MTWEEAAEVLGPELTAQADALAASWPPLTPEQIAAVAPLLVDHDPAASTDAA
jgi:hypothetical protein